MIWDFNVSLFYLINLNLKNPTLNILMPIVTTFGSLYLWLIGLSILFLLGGLKEKNTAILGIIALLLSSTIVYILKIVIAEPRPFIILENVNLLQNISSYSFPSGHTATAFAGALILGKKYGYIYLLIIVACFIGLSRAYVGVHYPLDILCGAIIGLICGWVILRYENVIFNNSFIRSYDIKNTPNRKI